MDFMALEVAFAEIKSDPALMISNNLKARMEALDTLSFIDEVIRHNPGMKSINALKDQVQQYLVQLGEINKRIFRETRELLKSNQSTPASLRALFNTYSRYKPGETGHIHIDYEALDVLLCGSLFPEKHPIPSLELKPGMVHWEASPGSVILDLVDHVPLGPGDLFVDVGSGLGNIAILVNVLRGVRTLGIEREPLFYSYAQQLANAFALDDVTFINTDALDADFSAGTVFYLFTPFVATILQDVMDKIRGVTHYHPVRVCSFGPCTPAISQLPWLHNTSGDGEHEFKLAVFTAGEWGFQ